MLGITTIRSVASSGDPDIDGLLIGQRWSEIGFSSPAVELWYAFPSRKVSYTDYGSAEDIGELESFEAATAAQRIAVRGAFSLISSYSLLSFKEDPFYHPSMTANDTTHSELLFGKTNANDTAHAYATDTPDDKAGDVWFNDSSGIYDTPVRGDYAFITVLHEIGHAVGLKHPHEAETFGVVSPGHDNLNFTVMSYRSYEAMDIGLGFANEEFGYAQTYMMYDIAALQHMYGANFAAIDNVYRWNPASGAATNNGVAWITPGANRVFLTVWDGGGIDTYDLSAYANAVSIDLNPGAWTQTSQIQLADLGDGHDALGNIANALLYKGDTRSLIENAKGGSNEDRLLGNQADNTLTGNGGNDTLEGRLGNDTLDGGTGHDILDGGQDTDLMRGGAGDDQYQVDDEADAIVELAGGGLDTVGSTADAYILPVNVEDLVGLSTTSGQHLTGNALANKISALGMGDNVLDGGTGADRMIGGFYDDTYHVDNVGDSITDDAGVDTIVSTIDWTLTEFFENLRLDGSADINGTGSWVADVIIGNGAANRLEGEGGDDTLDGGAGNDVLEGGAGIDQLTGSFGDDLFVIDALDLIIEAAGQGTDTVEVGFSYSLGDNLERLVLTGAAVEGTGNDLDNSLTGNTAANILNGGAGADTMTAGLGNDSYAVDNSLDQAIEAAGAGADLVTSSVSFTLGANVENLVLTGSAAINGTGNDLTNSLTGNSAENILNGGAGADTMTGGIGNDSYVVDNALDQAIEAAGAGTDSVTSSVSFALGANVENLFLSGSAAINGTGNTLANLITGNGAANTLGGGVGADTMTGGLGNDSYVVDNALDQAIEVAGAGTDKVTSSVSFTLGDNVESLILAGTAAINGTGNALGNVILGNDGANVLNGGAGADNMQGGLGNDSYVVDNALDKVTETSASGGTDKVTSSVGFALGTNVEQLILTGTGAINGTGNGLANVLTGNDGANVLNGGLGADTMTGGLGNDAYAVDSALDKVIETSAAGGTDRVTNSVSFTLGNNVENLTLTGVSAINGTGNGLANTILGNGAANILNGAAGADTMQGGLGSDTYVVDNVLDKAIETSATGGIDLVKSSVTFTLGGNVETLVLLGSALIDGTGNNGGNSLTGNSAANVLKGINGNDVIDGGAGNDQIQGGGGNDSLNGGTGSDQFVFNSALSAATNVDHILDFVHAIDEIQLENAVFTTLGAGALSAGAFRPGTAAVDADDRILYDAATGALYYDKDGTGGAAAVQFATLDNMPATLNATDFLVI